MKTKFKYIKTTTIYKIYLPKYKQYFFTLFHSIVQARWLWIILISFISGLAVYSIIGEKIGSFLALLSQEKYQFEILKSAGIWNFITLVIAIPTAFLIWFYRDQNNRQIIENARKDVNLKDFQKLSELAAGLHLVEDKVIQSEKNSNGVIEKTKIRESASVTEGDTISISRRDGAISLQIAAVYQMKAFLIGEYGKHFQRPAFQLLLSLWRAIVWTHISALEGINLSSRNFVVDWKIKLSQHTKMPLPLAIRTILTSDQGHMFREHSSDLQGITFAGIMLKNADFGHLNLNETNFVGIDFEVVNFRYTECNLSNFTGAVLSDVDFYRADLKFSKFIYADLYGVNFTKANMIHTNFIGGRFQDVIFKNSKLSYSDFEGAWLIQVDLSGADLEGVDFKGAEFTNVKFDKETNFSKTVCNESTRIFITNEFGVDKEATLIYRNTLKKQGLVLPDDHYTIEHINDKENVF